MELKFMTPTEVWEGFNPTQAPLESSIISSETDENFVCAKQFFTADTTPSGKLRAYMEVYYDKRWADDRATILIIPTLNPIDYKEFVKKLVQEGYVACVLDYAGASPDENLRTTFPQEYSYAEFSEAQARMLRIESDARHTPWYVWTMITRRAITLLVEHKLVDTEHIGVLGVSEGAHIAWQVAGTDARVRALVAINGNGYLWANGKPRFTSTNIPTNDEERAFSTGVGAETYSRFVTCPTLLIALAESNSSDVDRVGDVINGVKSHSKQLIISSGDEQITTDEFGAMLTWLRANFALGGKESLIPTINFEASDGELYVKINSIKSAKRRSLFVCYGEPFPYNRYWKPLDDLQKVGNHEYKAHIPVINDKELIVAYATFEFEDGNIVSTPVIGTVPETLDVRPDDNPADVYSARIIYDGSMGVGNFMPSTSTLIVNAAILHQAEGPFEIKGITTDEGDIVLYRSAHEIESLTRTTALHFDAYSPVERDLDVVMTTYPGFKKYVATAHLKGGEFWQKILLESADFKSDEGRTLGKFADTKCLYIKDATGVVFNNFLWV
ncbi:MAG: hypothetical protein IK048_01000 [Clostridia bacterium]|nr:hypothetical protein [Clostridia bacterium]